jgi:CRISPR/Cas system-associated endonuclease Cas3-HD
MQLFLHGDKVADRKDRFILIGYFEKLYRDKFGEKPVINKYNEQWAADALLESFGREDCEMAMRYYFHVNHVPSWKSYANNVDRLLNSIAMQQQDKESRKEMREKAREWLND